jgi:hypothetical protein
MPRKCQPLPLHNRGHEIVGCVIFKLGIRSVPPGDVAGWKGGADAGDEYDLDSHHHGISIGKTCGQRYRTQAMHDGSSATNLHLRMC